MIHSSRKLLLVALTALTLGSVACSVSAGGEIPCADDSSCPNDYPVCSGATATTKGKCIAGTASAASNVAVVGVDGHAPSDFVSGTVRLLVTAKARTGVQSVTLTSGTQTFPASATAATPPLFAFDVDTTTLPNADASLTATVNAGDGSSSSATATLHVDNARPVIQVFTADGGGTSAVASAGLTIGLSATFSGGTGVISASTGENFGITSGGTVLVSPGDTTTYTLHVTSHSGVAVQTGTTGQPANVSISVVARPAIASFQVSPATVTNGDVATLSFAVQFGACAVAGNCQITGPSGFSFDIPDTQNDGNAHTTPVTPPSSATSTYTLTIKNAATLPAALQATTAVQAVAAPTFTAGAFSVTPSTITAGDAGTVTFTLPTLSASVSSASILDGSNTAVVANALNPANLTIPKPVASTTYTLIARNAAGRVVQAATSLVVRVAAAAANTTLGASAATATVGDSVTLTPTFPVGYTGTINGPGLLLAVTSGGSYPVVVPAAGANNYTLHAINDATPAAQFTTQQTSVTGIAGPVITKFAASTATVTNGNTVTFSYNVTGGDCVAVAARCRITGPSFSFDIGATNDGTDHTSTAATPTSNSTSTYTLTLINSTGSLLGTVSRPVAVQAVGPIGAFSFAASPSSVGLSASGNVTFTQSGTITNAVTAVITGGGQSTGNILGQSTATLPVPDATTTYTLTVKNAAGDVAGTASKTATVLVGEPLGQAAVTSARYGAAAIRLPDGRVLVMGGSTDGTVGNSVSTATIYDPSTGAFSDGTGGSTATFAMTTGRAFHTATLITTTGVAPFLVYVAGGTTAVKSAELISVPAAGTAATASASDDLVGATGNHRCNHTATLVPLTGNPSAKVLLVGGTNCANATESATTELWTQGGTPAASVAGDSTTSAHAFHTATLLNDGTLLVAGGTGSSKAQVKAVPIDTGAWGTEKSLAGGLARGKHTATLLANGNVLLVGGELDSTTVKSSAELYNTSGGTFATAGGTGLTTARADHQAVLLSSGLALLLGGRNGDSSATFKSSEFYDPARDAFFAGSDMLNLRKQFLAVPLTAQPGLSGVLFIAGGTGLSSATTTPTEAMILP
jgi:hypothetical protein